MSTTVAHQQLSMGRFPHDYTVWVYHSTIKDLFLRHRLKPLRLEQTQLDAQILLGILLELLQELAQGRGAVAQAVVKLVVPGE